MAQRFFKHIFLPNAPIVRNFTSVSARGHEPQIPFREKDKHSKYLTERLKLAWQQADQELAVTHKEREGIYIEFESDPGMDLITKSLEDLRSKKIRLLNVRTENDGEKDVTYATVYVANDKRKFFLDKIEEYATKVTRSGKIKNQKLINSIADIRKAILVESFWQGGKELIPTDAKAWCEVWLSSDKDAVLQRFEELLGQEEIEKASGFIRFPERLVKLIFASKKQLERLTTISDDIAEYRRAKETTDFWIKMENNEQAQWVKDLLTRCRSESNPRVAVCILDTGVNNGHPLLVPVLANQDCLSVEPAWGVDDHKGHGTLMAGLAAYGDLLECLSSADLIHLRHCLESVKIVPRPPVENKQELWGYITGQGVSRAEIQAPDRNRILCMAIAAADTRDRGRPTSWSGQVDQIAVGVEDGNKRLFILSAGNLTDFSVICNYPAAQQTDSIHDPAQAWNALTVGAYTRLDQIKDKSLEGYVPLAPSGGLSPFSTTSLIWENKWPIKPEILMEGGNVIHNGSGSGHWTEDVSLLSTSCMPTICHFAEFNMTSAATAQASWFAAQLCNDYPDIWPETVRALMVHSAEWTDTLKKQFLPLDRDPVKADYYRLLRICGYGVPDLTRARYSASNNLTLIAQAEIQPFDQDEDGGYKTKEMHLYDLPWPKQVLLDLPDQTKVQMKVTLSYFIEPGPGEIGWRDRYRYASHGLRFDIKSPNETNEDFIKRINVAARENSKDNPGTESASSYWTIGSNGRDRGSIHSDIWVGSAAELATSGFIAVFPVIGWWRERAYLGKWNRQCRYSLVVSITSPAEEIDIYTPVANQIGITVPVSIQI